MKIRRNLRQILAIKQILTRSFIFRKSIAYLLDIYCSHRLFHFRDLPAFRYTVIVISFQLSVVSKEVYFYQASLATEN